MAEKGIPKRHAEVLAPVMVGRAILALGLALALAACAAPSMQTLGGVDKAGAFVETAVIDTEEIARRALAYNSANIRERAAIEVEEAEVILRKALDEQKRIRNVQRAAIVTIAALQAKVPSAGNRDTPPHHGSDVTAAVGRVDRISIVLAAMDLNVETIEQTVIALRELEIVSRHTINGIGLGDRAGSRVRNSTFHTLASEPRLGPRPPGPLRTNSIE